jgi:hypothetical protein
VKLSHVDTTAVKLRPLSRREIDRYIEREKPFDCAGGFKAEALGIVLFERIDTEDPTAIVGMPLIWLAGALARRGLSRFPELDFFALSARQASMTAARSAGSGALALNSTPVSGHVKLTWCACRNMRLRPTPSSSR